MPASRWGDDRYNPSQLFPVATIANLNALTATEGDEIRCVDPSLGVGGARFVWSGGQWRQTTSGTMTASIGQILYRTANGIEGAAKLTISGSVVTCGENTDTDPRLEVNGSANTTVGIRLRAAGVNRWTIAKDTTTEGGSNTGSRFVIIANDDSGGEIDRPIQIVRSAGSNIILGRPVAVTGGIGVWGVSPPGSRPTVNAAATDLATTTALLNQIRTALISCGIVQ